MAEGVILEAMPALEMSLGFWTDAAGMFRTVEIGAVIGESIVVLFEARYRTIASNRSYCVWRNLLVWGIDVHPRLFRQFSLIPRLKAGKFTSGAAAKERRVAS